MYIHMTTLFVVVHIDDGSSHCNRFWGQL